MATGRLPGGLAVATAVLLAPLAAVPAAAQQETAQQAPVVVTLDASGSMAQQLPTGETRMDAAKTALNALVDGLAPGAQLGMQVYGTGTGNTPEEKAAGCLDIVDLQGVGPVNAAELKQKVAGIQPSGYTPVGNALLRAAEALPEEGPGAVVLISDGIDTCAPPDPCEVARNLAADGVQLSIHTVGFQVDEEARRQLSCIAEQTGGSYTDVTDASGLDEQLPQIVERAQRTYEAQGQPITGSETDAQAPEIAAGQYVDTIDAGQRKYYRLKVPKGYLANFTASLIVPNDEVNGFTAKLTTRILDMQGGECVSGKDFATRWEPHVTVASWWPTKGSDCNATDEVYLEIEREGPDETRHWTYDVELLVLLEPPVPGSGGPAANTTKVPFAAPDGPEQAVTGGASFNDALELPGSGVYADEVGFGEMATYKVWLDWGESVAVRTNADLSGVPSWSNVKNVVHGPTRVLLGETWDAFNDESGALDPVATSRALYSNRTESTDDADLAGWHYITVRVDRESEPDKPTVPVRLFVSKGGEKAEGPQYAAAPGMPSGVTGMNPGDAEGGVGLGSLAELEEPSGGVPVWAWIALGGVVLAGGGATALILVLRKRKAVAPQPPQSY
ncbi:VWA domain-containing protein [Saccharopolyspora indica]|uniref:vWA domain-containing protein n=1 Tax=Saccharopolyspora indica TaxID=1229659 RepID=UPI0022EA44A6|nr:VWA domain-containing protein [Saccharopolyspora indica]MDA3646089.1 VWA domain-containing protein [Saccharopolyspora indica]